MDLEIPLISSSSRRLLNDKSNIIEVFDREPNGLIIRCKINSKEIFLPITEVNLSKSGFKRNLESLNELLNTLSVIENHGELNIHSTNIYISPIRRVEKADDVDNMLNSKVGIKGDTMRTVLLKGLVELCKVKPMKEESIEWLGNWLIENNPSQPVVKTS